MPKVFIEDPNSKAGMTKAVEATGYCFRLNVRSNAAEIGPDWTQADDSLMAHIRQEVYESCETEKSTSQGKMIVPLKYSKTAFIEIREVLLWDNQVDPFREYLDGVPVIELDPHDVEDYGLSIDRVFEDLFSTPGDAYYRHASRMIFLACVWRAYRPGYKIDEVVVLQGEQGLGKDAIIREMLPSEEYFTDALSFAEPKKDRIEKALGKVIVCASELGGVTTTKDLEALKSWITSTRDDVRLAYRHDPSNIQRRWYPVGTTNSLEPLPADPSGNRRWIVVPCLHGSHVEPFARDNRERWWSEAVALYRLGIKPNLPRDMKLSQSVKNADLSRSDTPIEDSLGEALAQGNLVPEEPYMMREIAFHVGLAETPEEWVRCPRQDMHRLRDVLLTQGWEFSRKRRDGRPLNLWTLKGEKDNEQV